MMLDHLRYRRYLDAYVDDEIDEALRGLVGRHVTTCPRCAADAAATRELKAALRRRTRSIRAQAGPLRRKWQRPSS